MHPCSPCDLAASTLAPRLLRLKFAPATRSPHSLSEREGGNLPGHSRLPPPPECRFSGAKILRPSFFLAELLYILTLGYRMPPLPQLHFRHNRGLIWTPLSMYWCTGAGAATSSKSCCSYSARDSLPWAGGRSPHTYCSSPSPPSKPCRRTSPPPARQPKASIISTSTAHGSRDFQQTNVRLSNKNVSSCWMSRRTTWANSAASMT